MKQILFATVYGPQAKAAFRFAQKLAQYFEAGITLVHVYKQPAQIIAGDPDLMYDDFLTDPPLQEDELWEQEKEKLRIFAASMEAKQFQTIPLDFIVSEGNIIDELKQIQERNDFDLIIMGMRKHSLGGRLFGNTTYKMIEVMESPILLIPPDIKYRGLDKIVYGTAFQAGEINAINHLQDWCQAFDATIDVVHAYGEKDKNISEVKMAELKKYFEAEEEVGIISFMNIDGNILQVLRKHLRSSNPDLLAIHKRKKGFWNRLKEGSFTKKLSEELEIPLLVFKSKEKPI